MKASLQRTSCVAIVCAVGMASTVTCAEPAKPPSIPYEADWESLRRYNYAPDWFRDAKFGVYFHWGIYSVPAFGDEWYPRHMHRVGSREHAHHSQAYGDPAEWPYDRFVPRFTAEQFDADGWVDLFVKAGARFAGPVAEHHDGYAMWDSALTPWDAAETGPRRDLVGEFADAARRRGLRFVTTFHHARNHLRAVEREGTTHWEGHYSTAMESAPRLLEDKRRALLYGYMPRNEFLAMWRGKLVEVIDRYEPDLIWFDSWLHEIPETDRRTFLAHYLNRSREWGRDVVVTHKQQDLPEGVGVLDIEKGGMERLVDTPWLTDDTISRGSWCYTEGLEIKSADVVLHSLIDIVSKNGQLLLNVSPKADGTIPADQREVLLRVGEWLTRYGEAVYGTRPFVTHGHGPTATEEGHFGGIALDKSYTAEDVRYTRRGDTVYAILLGAPDPGSAIDLPPFAGQGLTVERVGLVGSEAAASWSQTAAGLRITSPDVTCDEMANVYRVSLARP